MSVAGRVGVGGIVIAVALVIGSGAPGAAPPPKDIVLTSIGAYDTPFFDQGAVEIAAYDSKSQRAFLTFASLPRIEVIDLSDPTNPSLAHIINLTPWGGNDAHATSVAVHNGVVAAALPQGPEDTAPGKVVFFDAFGNHLSDVTVGALPDMLTFSPNGSFVVTADEGQPLSDYSFDPEGSVSIIDMRGGAESSLRRTSPSHASRRSTRRPRLTRASASSDLARPSLRISSRNTWRSRTTRRRPG